jgi:hypothetical protein
MNEKASTRGWNPGRDDRVIGIDLDNTLACYDELFHAAACEEGLIESVTAKSKEKIRDAIRLLPDGESKWTRLQAIVYGPRMSGAIAFPGCEQFLRHCAKRGTKTLVVSHKTAFAPLDGKQVDLRQAARDWMESRNFFGANGRGLSPEKVFFESTRAEKVETIRALGCTHFIDDLAEVFAEPNFPPGVSKLLFAPHGAVAASTDVKIFKSWLELDQFFFP